MISVNKILLCTTFHFGLFFSLFFFLQILIKTYVTTVLRRGVVAVTPHFRSTDSRMDSFSRHGGEPG